VSDEVDIPAPGEEVLVVSDTLGSDFPQARTGLYWLQGESLRSQPSNPFKASVANLQRKELLAFFE
jgi:hypothetical protein